MGRVVMLTRLVAADLAGRSRPLLANIPLILLYISAGAGG